MKKIIKYILIAVCLLSVMPSYAKTTDNYSIQYFLNSKMLSNIHNFNRVDNNYYRGGQPTIKSITALKNIGIRTIINLRNENPKKFSKEQKVAIKNGIKYINIPMTPSSPPSEDQINQFFTVLNNPDNLPVFVHCWQGKDRTGIMTALYRLYKYNWSFDSIYEEMRLLGYHVYFYPQQKWFLAQYVKNHSVKI